MARKGSEAMVASPPLSGALSRCGQCRVQNADDPVDFNVAAYACLPYIFGNHVFVLDNDKPKQLTIIGRIGTKPVHLSGRRSHGIQRDPRVAACVRLVTGIKVRRHIPFHQSFDHELPQAR